MTVYTVQFGYYVCVCVCVCVCVRERERETIAILCHAEESLYIYIPNKKFFGHRFESALLLFFHSYGFSLTAYNDKV